MKISVVIPVYNKEKYVRNCLMSCLNQTFDDYEVIVINDGSRDGSADICKEMARDHKRIRLIEISNSGVTAARRVGVENARGEYITFVDSDDRLLPESLSILYGAMEESRADEVFAAFQSDRGNIISTGRTGFQCPRDMIREILECRANFGMVWGILYRKPVLEGCLDTPREVVSGEDRIMQIKCLLKNPKVFFIPESTYVYFMGVPNDRKPHFEMEKLVDRVLLEALHPQWETYKDSYTTRQLKVYENYVNMGRYDEVKDYFRKALKGNLNGNVPLTDRIAYRLPAWLARYAIRLRKKLL